MDRGSATAFSEMGTLGIEEEFYVVDERGQPTDGIEDLVYESEPPEILEDRLDHELFKFVIETQTPTIDSFDEAGDVLRSVRAALCDHARGHGYHLAAAGLHPTAKWYELAHAEKPRYRAQLDRIQYPQHRNTTAGLHVHVGVDDADKAVWVANEVRQYLPILLALSANSPFWCGIDTGLASARASIFETLPNTGIPTAFEDFAAFEAFEQRMVESDSIDDRGELWFDVRPHTTHGTVEVRTPDAQADPERVMGFVEYVHALVCDLAAAYEDGVSGSTLRHEFLVENKWRACRYGHEATLLTEDGSMSLEGLVERECDRLDVDGLWSILDAGSGTSRQRRIAEEEDMEAVARFLELEDSRKT